jgi:hypothetical protein
MELLGVKSANKRPQDDQSRGLLLLDDILPNESHASTQGSRRCVATELSRIRQC